MAEPPFLLQKALPIINILSNIGMELGTITCWRRSSALAAILKAYLTILGMSNGLDSRNQPTTSIPGVLATPGPGRPSDASADKLVARQVQQPWAGAVQEGRGFSYVTGTVRVSWIAGQPSNSAISAWVGIDGLSCQNAILQTGLSFYGNGAVVPWSEWWPAPSYQYANPPFRASAGDEVRMTVHAWSATSGNSTLENLTTGQMVVQEFYNQRPLCNTDADFVLEKLATTPVGMCRSRISARLTFRIRGRMGAMGG
ncbi:hypothetical protein J3458_012939 [Metarhizium acridum]|uniref:uncharacterized protein n=1 Tax=Metarhizium acridum TaxID=92637 RepID=UPI001C6B3660|nr:hypothetical protein J3458_012939 [Metarhizium acridum]